MTVIKEHLEKREEKYFSNFANHVSPKCYKMSGNWKGRIQAQYEDGLQYKDLAVTADEKHQNSLIEYGKWQAVVIILNDLDNLGYVELMATLDN